MGAKHVQKWLDDLYDGYCEEDPRDLEKVEIHKYDDEFYAEHFGRDISQFKYNKDNVRFEKQCFCQHCVYSRSEHIPPIKKSFYIELDKKYGKNIRKLEAEGFVQIKDCYSVPYAPYILLNREGILMDARTNKEIVPILTHQIGSNVRVGRTAKLLVPLEQIIKEDEKPFETITYHNCVIDVYQRAFGEDFQEATFLKKPYVKYTKIDENFENRSFEVSEDLTAYILGTDSHKPITDSERVVLDQWMAYSKTIENYLKNGYRLLGNSYSGIPTYYVMDSHGDIKDVRTGETLKVRTATIEEWDGESQKRIKVKRDVVTIDWYDYQIERVVQHTIVPSYKFEYLFPELNPNRFGHSDQKFYVYVHKDPKTNEILYIGKGTGNRFESNVTRSPAHKQALLDGRLKCEIIINDLTEQMAYELESALISTYISNGKILYNIQKGHKTKKSRSSR